MPSLLVAAATSLPPRFTPLPCVEHVTEPPTRDGCVSTFNHSAQEMSDNEWTAERIAELRRVLTEESFMFVAGQAVAAVPSLLDALESARRERDEVRAYADQLEGEMEAYLNKSHPNELFWDPAGQRSGDVPR